MLDHTSFIDGFIPATHVLIEQKGIGKDLRKPIKQSDGSRLTPFQQAKRYSAAVPFVYNTCIFMQCFLQRMIFMLIVAAFSPYKLSDIKHLQKGQD